MSSLVRQHWLILLVMATSLPAFLVTIRPLHNWGGDFAVYLQQSGNFAAGQPYRQSTFIPTPESELNHPASYPPLPSVLMAPVYAARGLDYTAFKTLQSMFFWLSLPVWYAVGAQMGLSPISSALSVFVFGFSSILFAIKDNIGSDGLYVLLSAICLWAILKGYRQGYFDSRPIFSAVIIAGLLLLTLASRSSSLALLAAFGIHEAYYCWTTRRLRLFSVVSCLLLAAGFLVYTRWIYNSGSIYASQFIVEPGLYLRNFIYYLRSPANLWSGAPSALRYPLTVAVVLLAAYSVYRCWRRNISVIEIYLAVSAAMLISYTENNDVRYAVPVFPILLMLAARAWEQLPAPAWIRWAPAALLFTAALCNLKAVQTGPIADGIANPSFVPLCEFLSGTPRDTLLLSWNPRLIALYTRRPSALYPKQPPAEGYASFLDSSYPDALLIVQNSALDQGRLAPFLADAPKPVFTHGDFRVYSLRKASTGAR